MDADAIDGVGAGTNLDLPQQNPRTRKDSWISQHSLSSVGPERGHGFASPDLAHIHRPDSHVVAFGVEKEEH